jgi:hypothetical protein
MSEDQHYNGPNPEIPEALQDRKGTDMPAARTILVVILATISIVVLIVSIRFAVKDSQAPETTPAVQERLR